MMGDGVGEIFDETLADRGDLDALEDMQEMFQEARDLEALQEALAKGEDELDAASTLISG
eukprot:COSAG06_NODE_1999_length_7878_cov_39.455200_2_plen_60_part_00